MKFWTFIYLTLLFPLICHAQQNSLDEDFSTCSATLPNNWKQYSVTGSDTWKCTASGYTNNAVFMNGYSGGNNNLNEDWLISPQIILNQFAAPTLSFYCRTKFAGKPIQVYVSNNYLGSGNPNLATWTLLNANLPATNSDSWFFSDKINLTNFKNQAIHIAFKYTSNTDSASLWRVDNIQVYENGITLPNSFLNVGQTEIGSPSITTNFQFTISSFGGTLNVIAPPPFEISKNNINFLNQLNYDSTISAIPQTVYIRINPTIADKVYRDSIVFLCNGNQSKNVEYLLGTSLPDNKTLRVVNWNMRWFGEPSWCACDTSLAKANAIKILKDLHADIYCIQEMVSLTKLAELSAALGPEYDYIAAPYGSGAPNPQSGFYASCQKNTYIFNTQKIQNTGTFGLLKSTYPNDSFAYNCFASGRYPFVMQAKLNLENGISDTILFTNIHAKASNTQNDYDRRACAAQLMTDSLNGLFSNKKVIVIGDYNDLLEGSNVAGNVTSPYKYLLDHNFSGITLPSLFPGQSTYIGSTDYIIDNIACNQSMNNHYVPNSFFIFTEGPRYIENFKNTTSDHYPCMSYYRFNFPNAIKDVEFVKNSTHFLIENPSKNSLKVFMEKEINEQNQLSIYNLFGQIIYKTILQYNSTYFELPATAFPKGLYLVEIANSQWKQTQKWILE
ncbi:MAG: choice-of-anchor J domain-containing protein [Chitinophagaceae bacterium]|nr:choice-of-anchor J domain-containing protein [Chitinophagaceae bacterium]HMN33492.1 choice-of-anchor J domain-containing protein [Chitinophagaceae bacterium]